MSVYGIISEFNPFHNGHKYIIDSAKASGADAVVCIMSGNAVQRGELALIDKYYRAEMTLSCGADLVVELPYPWCASGAESFAACGVRIASELADTLYFGSECGDISELTRAAEICGTVEFVEEYKQRLTGNTGSAESYFELLSEKTGRAYSSNDILGIEYIKAGNRLDCGLTFATVKRNGGDYRSENIYEGKMQSATAIRKSLFDKGIESVAEYMPSEALRVLESAIKNGELSDMSRIDSALRLYFRMCEAKDMDGVADTDLGLASRICRAARESTDGSLLEDLRTKRYTDSRLRRALLFGITRVMKEDIVALPEYVNLLGANEKGRQLLSAKRKSSSLRILAKASDIPISEAAARQAELSSRLDALFSLAIENKSSAGDMLKKHPVIF